MPECGIIKQRSAIVVRKEAAGFLQPTACLAHKKVVLAPAVGQISGMANEPRKQRIAVESPIEGWLPFAQGTERLAYPVNKAAFRFIDLFAGIGGLRMGFESIGGECVYTSEWDPAAQKTYQANFKCEHPLAGDITQVDVADIPQHDVLLAGFPCQPFSIAGVSKKKSLGKAHGFACETQGTLFFDIARILKHHRPPAFLLENVKNLVSHDKGNTFRVIRNTLESELGYHVSAKVINAKGFVPQNRERIFLVGFSERTGFDFDELEVPDIANGPELRSILHPEDGTEKEEPPYTHGVGSKVNSKYTLSAHLWRYLRDYAEKHRAKGNGFGFGMVGPEDVARTLSARYYKDGSEILVKQRGNRPRRLTPRECARLMGFDAAGRPRFDIPVSDTQAYKQFGNAVVVPVVETVAKHMLPFIREVIANGAGEQRSHIAAQAALSLHS
ncbi:MAG: DNA (cytosine-5-)-methyltransferase [Gammaproteobacteria bacterium]|nr:DNA (cytosine-5-)-methyltransferase [Gammaproteobacteria bacterium]MCY4341189.1 DNA (cytosine-5-)-methyltransferase [Gammaproteobacteria bacterium]